MKTWMLSLCGLAVAIFLNACASVNPPLLTARTPQEEVREAARIMRDFRNLPEPGIPAAILRNARGIAVLEVARGGAGVTGRAGKGIVAARTRGGWSGPAFIATGGVGFGPQIGGSVTELVLILNTREAVEAFARGGTVELTGSLSAVAGPVGRTAEIGAVPVAPVYSPTFSTRGLEERMLRVTSAPSIEGLHYTGSGSPLLEQFPSGADAGWRLGRQSEVELFEQELLIGFGLSVAA